MTCNNNFNFEKIVLYVWYIILLILFFSIISCLQSCKSVKYVSVPEYHTDTLYKARKDSINVINVMNVKDSTNIKDSVVLHVNSNGDIIGKDTWHWRNRYRSEKDSTNYYRNKLDSVSHSKVDSIYKPYPVINEKVVHKLYWWQKISMWIGIISIISIVIGIILKIKNIKIF